MAIYFFIKNGEEKIVKASSKKEVAQFFKIRERDIKIIKKISKEDKDKIINLEQEKLLKEAVKNILDIEKRLFYLNDNLNLNKGDKVFFRKKVFFVLDKISKIGYKITNKEETKIVPFF